ncbi:fumarylacetoacetate hydrolase family protein [Methyloversatilis sp.]|uniref:fumarylacetoacetate hydrolase family protein n=1 Tax=Methyloversatilis sp. TaxID=2569862 RepID=UPI00273475A8|nr:fumarylacetoacetate hydrolase family protein [Methyloversatilis sp.]MDP2867969.1 fumarylacetoacetate hydrolase family protein [Methyloversatilis sp.]MDP3456795.1 fumarylacetoacetate hydrolase family protein [Methyloversatilis sp.]MDP3576417.1 fumarylacetoacetate hydrolase family protein [Methyloversatilis sp.]
MPLMLFPLPVPTLPVQGEKALFPVRRIYCVGRNYAEHAREMGHDPALEAPFFFSKPADAVVNVPAAVAYPPATRDLQHEVELVVALHGGGRALNPAQARACIFGYGVGLDLTRRDLQRAARDKGQPWDMGKGFDQSAPVSQLVPATVCGHPRAGQIELSVNGQMRQRGDLADMILDVDTLLVRLSQLVELRAGDLLFTGTPAGVAALHPGDCVSARVEGVAELRVDIAPPQN